MLKALPLAAFVLLATTAPHEARAQANTKLSNLVAATAVNQALLPSSTNTKDLGSSTYGWRNLYLRGDVYLDGTRFLSNSPGTTALNVFVGSYSGKSITKGVSNTGLGHNALYYDTSGSHNTAVGTEALYSNRSGGYNIAVGSLTLHRNISGGNNTATGYATMNGNTTGSYNTATGFGALNVNTTGSYNTATGYLALYRNNANGNTAHGNQALYHNTTGNDNVANGAFALHNNTTGYRNTASGYGALLSNNTGQSNTAIGDFALNRNTTGYNNTALGVNADVAYNLIATNVTVIGANAIVDASNKVRIGNTDVTSIGGQVGWTTFSDGRYKQNIKQDVQGLDFINSLNPVTYTVDIKGLNAYYNKGRKERPEGPDETVKAEQAKGEAAASAIIYNGFVAQEVEAAAKKLNYAFSGVDKPQSKDGLYGLRYADFVVPLVKAVQELSKKNEVLEEKNISQQKQIDELRQMMLQLKNGSTNAITSNMGYLEQNTPNPVNGTTTIRYHVPETAASAMLNVTNAKGQVVKTLSLNNRGTGQLNLNTQALASGAYNYTLFVNGKQTDSKRLVIAR